MNMFFCERYIASKTRGRPGTWSLPNFVKRHNTLRCTPAMVAGVTPSFWSVGDLLEAVA